MSEFKMVELTEEQVSSLEEKLEAYDNGFMEYPLSGSVQIGIEREGRIVAGADAVVTAFRILYVSTVYVEEAFRGQGLGRQLMEALEAKAVQLGVNQIRLDTFGFQGAEFYPKLGYQEVGSYENVADGYSEHFFVKMI